MTNDEIESAVERALQTTKAVPAALRSAAFGVVLCRLLSQGSSVSLARNAGGASGLDMPLASLPEFSAQVQPKTHPQWMVTFAYYIFKSGDGRGITVKEIEESYRQIRQRKPKNVSDTIAACVGQGRGWLIEAPERKDGSKAWIITPRGEAYVESGFQA